MASETKVAEEGLDELVGDEEELFEEEPMESTIVGNDVDMSERLLLNLRFLQNGKAGLTAEDDDLINQLQNEEDFDLQIVIKVAESLMKHIYSKAINPAQIEFIFNCMFGILPWASDFEGNVDRISAFIADQDGKYGELNIRLLTDMFNLVGESNDLRPVIMQRLLDYVVNQCSIQLADAFKSRLKNLQKWMKSWNISVEETKKLLDTAFKLARRAQDSEQAQHFLIEYLKQYSSEDTINDDEVIASASQAVIAEISSATINTRILMELSKSPPVRAMANYEKYRHIHELLLIVYQGTVKDFLDFLAKNEKILQSLGLEKETLLPKMRRLTLCALGNDYDSLSFTQMCQYLQVDTVEEMELLVIECVMDGLLQAKIDHSNKLVVISRSTQRVFNDKTWVTIGNKLEMWQNNIEEILKIIQDSDITKLFAQQSVNTQMGTLPPPQPSNQ